MIRFFLLFLAFLASCGRTVTQQEVRNSSFFRPVPILGYTDAGLPQVGVDIEGKQYVVMLDLGAESGIELSDPNLKKVKRKKATGSRVSYNARGNHYQSETYRIDRVDFGVLGFNDIAIRSYPLQMHEDAQIGIGKPLKNIQGLVGWKMFQKIGLFLDIPNDRVVFVHGIEDVEQNGYARDDFIETPLKLVGGTWYFEIELDGKRCFCLLDSGSTHNLVSAPANIDCSLERLNVSLKIGETRMGFIEVAKFPFPPNFRGKAVLGMEFLRGRQVLVDMPHQRIYFRKKSC